MNEDEVLSSAVQRALLSAAKQTVGPLRQLRVVINQQTGDIQAFAKLLVVERVVDKHEEISLLDARRIKQQAAVGEELDMEVTPAGFARIASRFAKQVLMDHVQRAEEGL